MKSDANPCLSISNILVCVAYVDDCLFWDISQGDIDEVLKSFEYDGPKHHW